MRTFFSKVAAKSSRALGHPLAFVIALLVITGWAAAGPALGYSQTWLLAINTCTTIITFLSVFLIQNSQNRESMAMQLKLDEIIRSIKEARDEIIDLEDMPEEHMKKVAKEFQDHRKGVVPGKTFEEPSAGPS